MAQHIYCVCVFVCMLCCLFLGNCLLLTITIIKGSGCGKQEYVNVFLFFSTSFFVFSSSLLFSCWWGGKCFSLDFRGGDVEQKYFKWVVQQKANFKYLSTGALHFTWMVASSFFLVAISPTYLYYVRPNEAITLLNEVLMPLSWSLLQKPNPIIEINWTTTCWVDLPFAVKSFSPQTHYSSESSFSFVSL